MDHRKMNYPEANVYFMLSHDNCWHEEGKKKEDQRHVLAQVSDNQHGICAVERGSRAIIVNYFLNSIYTGKVGKGCQRMRSDLHIKNPRYLVTLGSKFHSSFPR